MALPGITNTILGNGLGVTTPATSRPHVLGACESGVENVPTLISNQRQLRETFGAHGPLIDCIGYILDHAGGPVLATKTTDGVAATYDGGTTSAVVASVGGGADNEINLAIATSAPKNDFNVVVTIVTGGVLAATTFTYSLDGGVSDSPATAALVSTALADTGITLEFEAGSTDAYVAGATYSFECKAPHYTSANLSTAFTATALSVLTFDYFVFAGEAVSGAEAATLFSAVSTALASAVTTDKYYGAILGAGDDTPANILTAQNGLTDARIAVVQGSFRTAPVFGTVGRSLPHLPSLNLAAARAAGNVMSTDLAQTAGASSVGPARGAPLDGLTHNEYTENAGLDDAKIGSMRTYAQGAQGVFLTNVHMKSPSGSDFEYWQHRRIMDEACKVISAYHISLVSSSVVVKTDGSGSLAEFAAQSIEKGAQRLLDSVIGAAARDIGPSAISGRPGHVTDIAYQVDRTNNLLSTKELIATVSIIPFGYLKRLTTTFSYKLAI